jgi:hypothetical protein
LTRSIPEIEADLATHEAERNQPDHVAPALQAELLAARNNEAVAERIVSMKGWLAMQHDESERCRLAVEQLQFLVDESDAEIAKLTTTGDALMARVSEGQAAVSAAIAAGDAAAAALAQETVNSAGQALATIPPLIQAAQANKAAAAAQLPAAEMALSLPLAYVRNAELEITRITGLDDGTAWNEPTPPPPQEIPWVLSLAQRMALETRLADNAKLLRPDIAVGDVDPQASLRSRRRSRRARPGLPQRTETN